MRHGPPVYPKVDYGEVVQRYNDCFWTMSKEERARFQRRLAKCFSPPLTMRSRWDAEKLLGLLRRAERRARAASVDPLGPVLAERIESERRRVETRLFMERRRQERKEEQKEASGRRAPREAERQEIRREKAEERVEIAWDYKVKTKVRLREIERWKPHPLVIPKGRFKEIV
ncbi:MAG: hypothetical protein ACE5JS_23440 [Nitrospinota bacterium]